MIKRNPPDFFLNLGDIVYTDLPVTISKPFALWALPLTCRMLVGRGRGGVHATMERSRLHEVVRPHSHAWRTRCSPRRLPCAFGAHVGLRAPQLAHPAQPSRHSGSKSGRLLCIRDSPRARLRRRM